MTLRRSAFWALPFAFGVAGCSGTETKDAVAHGAQLFGDRHLSPSELNRFSCATCHDAEAGQADVRKAGAVLAGVLERPSYWGGQENDLLAAINACLRYFMQAVDPLPADAPEAEALYAYLASLGPGAADPVPFTVVRSVENIPRGNIALGVGLYTEVCSKCHGSTSSGKGRITDLAPVLPEETLLAHASYEPSDVRLVFIEKTRHGGFLGYGGSMPPFSRETLSDEELADILEFMGVIGE